MCKSLLSRRENRRWKGLFPSWKGIFRDFSDSPRRRPCAFLRESVASLHRVEFARERGELGDGIRVEVLSARA